MNTIIINADILNEGKIFRGHLEIENEIIKNVLPGELAEPRPDAAIVDAQGLLLMPGIIDDQVHFREPGLTAKADIFSESRAAAAGGVTSFMDMPNTSPPADSLQLLEQKFEIAAQRSAVNYSFYLGASNDNIAEIRQIDPARICGLKLFMGSSTGNMLVDNPRALSAVFAESPVIVAAHCEDENIIRTNLKLFRYTIGDDADASIHPRVRDAEACFLSTRRALELAARYSARLHVLHLSTGAETRLFDPVSPDRPLPKVTAEACVHHLWFCDRDYKRLGNKIKCNPAIKSATDRDALRNAVREGKVAVVATDHAPHLRAEKQLGYFDAPSGLPLVQHSLSAMFELYRRGVFSLFDIVERMCHSPARLFGIRKRGFIRKDYYADLTLLDYNSPFSPAADNILHKCRWSPFEGVQFSARPAKTWVNGTLVYDNGEIRETKAAKRLEFDR
ncbi:MAG: dihydroorotase [Prevotellaceae bacterium]|jgi:dihydroorotase|nr:dihydroorotase [Prevotellaceae bacterium]